MASTRTRQDLILEVLDCLGVIGEGQTPNPSEIARVDEKLESIADQYAGLEVVYISDLNNIDDRYFSAFADICAFECMSKFGVSGDDASTLSAKLTAAVGKLKIITRGRSTREVLRTEYI